MSRPAFPLSVQLVLRRLGSAETRRGDEVLLLRRYHTGYEDGKYALVAGHVEEGESILTAMVREAREEAGITLLPADLRVVQVMHRKNTGANGPAYVDYLVEATRWQGEVYNAEPQKCDDLRWFPLSALPQNTIPYIREALAHYRQGTPFTFHGW